MVKKDLKNIRRINNKDSKSKSRTYYRVVCIKKLYLVHQLISTIVQDNTVCSLNPVNNIKAPRSVSRKKEKDHYIENAQILWGWRDHKVHFLLLSPYMKNRILLDQKKNTQRLGNPC